MEERHITIAIDGPAGSGKSSVAKEVARRLNLAFLDTGAMYRCVSYLADQKGIEPTDNDGLKAILDNFDFKIDSEEYFLNGNNVTKDIRTKRVDSIVSGYAANPYVRKRLVEVQQAYASVNSVIMEGRDICSVVLPNATDKFYFDASCEERARRRFKQNVDKGIESNYETILEEIIRRDEIDSSRDADPLKVSEDALYVDTSKYTFDEMVDLVIEHVNGER